jgi:hypothetical protein
MLTFAGHDVDENSPVCDGGVLEYLQGRDTFLDVNRRIPDEPQMLAMAAYRLRTDQ